ncbi:MAG: SGNH/GDSL hydrolase family protein [Planctomycetota bacterium]
MSTRSLVRSLTASSLLALLATAVPGQIRFLAIGDSITEGVLSFPSYRFELFTKLRDPYCADFRGIRSGVAGGWPASRNWDFDQDHLAISGARTDEIDSVLGGHLTHPESEADFALIHLGTNDGLQGRSVVAARQSIEAIIAKLYGINPNIQILIAKIMPPKTLGSPQDLWTVGFNTELNNILTTYPNVVFVDHYTAFRTSQISPNQLWRDEYHPGTQGEQLMANEWHTKLLPYLLAVVPDDAPCVTQYGSGCPDTVTGGPMSIEPRLGAEYSNPMLPRIGQSYRLLVSEVAAAAPVVGILGPKSQTQIPNTQCFFYASVIGGYVAPWGAADGQGRLVVVFPALPNDPNLVGASLFYNAFYVSTSLTTHPTNGVDARIGV